MTEIKPGQSIELLKHLHILTRDGQMNQDSRRKLKQVYHLCQFIEPLLNQIEHSSTIVDHGAGKSYLGFILYDLYLKTSQNQSTIIGIETREELVKKLKNFCGTGGSAKDNEMLIQGNQKEKVVQWLHKNGYSQAKML